MNSQLLEKFYRNECTPEEIKEVLRWFEQEEPGNEQDQALHAVWQQAALEKEAPAYAHDPDRIFKNIMAQRNTADEHKPEEDMPVRQLFPNTWKRYLKIAAVLLLPLCCAWLLMQKVSDKQAPQLVTIKTQPGVKKTINLADGSVIKLHSGSSISYPENFRTNRTITLEGEAFFEVAKDSLNPFTVNSGTIRTQALGTSFNISHQGKDSTISVSLVTGSVKVEQQKNKNAQQLASLAPGQQLVYHKRNASYQVSQFDPNSVLGWKDGVLAFENASLEDVVHELERWYGLQVTVQVLESRSRKAEWHYTGSYKNQPVEAVLQGISFVKKLSYSRPDSNTVILSLNENPASGRK